MSSIVAQTILQQLGGRRFIMMTGAKDLVGSDEHGLSFRIGSNSSNANHVHIKLDANDTYTVVFGSVRAGKYSIRETQEGIYCDMIQEVFTKYTGMYTRL